VHYSRNREINRVFCDYGQNLRILPKIRNCCFGTGNNREFLVFELSQVNQRAYEEEEAWLEINREFSRDFLPSLSPYRTPGRGRPDPRCFRSRGADRFPRRRPSTLACSFPKATQEHRLSPSAEARIAFPVADNPSSWQSRHNQGSTLINHSSLSLRRALSGSIDVAGRAGR
jgi:hypothetical protein